MARKYAVLHKLAIIIIATTGIFAVIPPTVFEATGPVRKRYAMYSQDSSTRTPLQASIEGHKELHGLHPVSQAAAVAAYNFVDLFL